MNTGHPTYSLLRGEFLVIRLLDQKMILMIFCDCALGDLKLLPLLIPQTICTVKR